MRMCKKFNIDIEKVDGDDCFLGMMDGDKECELCFIIDINEVNNAVNGNNTTN